MNIGSRVLIFALFNIQFFAKIQGMEKPEQVRAVQTDGKIIVAELDRPYLKVIRYNKDKSIDSSFRTNLMTIPAFLPDDIVIYSDGKILIRGFINEVSVIFVKLIPNGNRDISFGTSGWKILYPLAIRPGKTVFGPT